MQDNSKCAAVSIQEQLRSVPYEHRHWFSDDPTSHHHIPVGRVCHEAANLLDSQAKELDTLRTHLKAVVEAGEAVVPEVYALTRQVIAYQTQSVDLREQRFERATTKIKADALTAAIEAAKEDGDA